MDPNTQLALRMVRDIECSIAYHELSALLVRKRGVEHPCGRMAYDALCYVRRDHSEPFRGLDIINARQAVRSIIEVRAKDRGIN